MIDFYDSCIESVRKYPLLSLGFAASAGLVAGILLAGWVG
jgi:ElaB/YqjD/DUF883 family membrane-anchored ribosome-binding protein